MCVESEVTIERSGAPQIWCSLKSKSLNGALPRKSWLRDFSVQPLCSLGFCGVFLLGIHHQQRHREHRGCTENGDFLTFRQSFLMARNIVASSLLQGIGLSLLMADVLEKGPRPTQESQANGPRRPTRLYRRTVATMLPAGRLASAFSNVIRSPKSLAEVSAVIIESPFLAAGVKWPKGV